MNQTTEQSGPIAVCPACGEPLYGWLEVPAAAVPALLRRCENCRLGLLDGTTEEDVIAALRDAATSGELRLANRRSVQAGLGAAHWAAIDPTERSSYLTPESLRLLAPRAGLAIAGLRSARWGRSQTWMWQTIVNSFTFHENFAREVRSRRLTARTGRGRVAFAIDALVTVLAGPLVALVSVPLELVSALAGRGGELIASVAVEPE